MFDWVFKIATWVRLIKIIIIARFVARAEKRLSRDHERALEPDDLMNLLEDLG